LQKKYKEKVKKWSKIFIKKTKN